MGFVTWLVGTADGYLASAAETQFAAIAATLGGVIAASATLVIILVLVNMAYQYRSMDGRSAFGLCAKLALITIFALNWVQFNYVASAILNGIDTIAGSLISSIGGPAVGPSGTFAEEFDDILNALSRVSQCDRRKPQLDDRSHDRLPRSPSNLSSGVSRRVHPRRCPDDDRHPARARTDHDLPDHVRGDERTTSPGGCPPRSRSPSSPSS